MATHSSVLSCRIPWTEKPGRLQSMGSHRVGHDWSDLAAAAALWGFVHFSPFSTRMLKLWGQNFFCHLQQYLAYKRCSLCIYWIEKLIYSDENLYALSLYRFIYLNLVILSYSFFQSPPPCYLDLLLLLCWNLWLLCLNFFIFYLFASCVYSR